MLTSKDILEQTGLSRATLNNYIAAGLIGRPEVLPPGPQDGDAPRIGYFPDDTVERIETIQRLKREGWSLGRIVEFFAKGGEAAPAATPSASAPLPIAGSTSASTRVAKASGSDSPQVMVLAILAVTLHDADSLWVALSVQDYFALTNEVSAEIRRIAFARDGHVTRVAPHRFVCRFLPKLQSGHLWTALEASRAIQDAVREISTRWKLRRDWGMDILANAGLCEGESWVAPSPQEDVQIVGETLDDAQQLARCARAGSLLVTRSLVARLPEALRSRVVHGVPATGQREGAPSRLMTFARLREIAPLDANLPRRIAALPVTEIVEVRAAQAAEWKEQE
jgi:class 3 adenylate cyclase